MPNMKTWEEKVLDLMRHNRWTVVAISGATNTGKSTITSKLVATLPHAQSINQDIFFRDPKDPHHIWIELLSSRKHQNWEHVDSVNWTKLCERICQIVSQPMLDAKRAYLFLDGHIILNHKPIAAICGMKFFIDLDKRTVYSRRVHRNYDPPDPEGYFEQVVWPMYLTNKDDLKCQKNIVYVDGSQSIDKIFDLIYNKLNK